MSGGSGSSRKGRSINTTRGGVTFTAICSERHSAVHTTRPSETVRPQTPRPPGPEPTRPDACGVVRRRTASRRTSRNVSRAMGDDVVCCQTSKPVGGRAACGRAGGNRAGGGGKCGGTTAPRHSPRPQREGWSCWSVDKGGTPYLPNFHAGHLSECARRLAEGPFLAVWLSHLSSPFGWSRTTSNHTHTHTHTHTHCDTHTQ